MEQVDELKMHREVIVIEGDRKLYNYTFDLEASDEDSPKPKDDEE